MWFLGVDITEDHDTLQAYASDEGCRRNLRIDEQIDEVERGKHRPPRISK